MMSPFAPTNDLGAWNAILLLVIYTVVIFGVGLTMMIRRDA